MNPVLPLVTTLRTTNSPTSHSQLPAPAGPVLRQRPAPGEQPVLLAGYKVRKEGPPCEVAKLLCARCEALAALQPDLARLNAYNAMIMEVGDVRDDEKGRVISMLLAQLIVLPEAARTDALRDVYLDTPDTTVKAIPLLLTLSMPDAEKARLFATAIANPVQRQLTTETWLQMLASIVPWAVNSSLSPQQASALLTAPAIPADEKAPFRSNTLLTALHNSAAWFVDLYVMHVAGAALPDDVKAALLSGSNEKEIKDCMKSADAATREAYERQVSASLLAGPVKQDLLRYC